MNDWEIKLLFFQTLTQKMKIKESGIFFDRQQTLASEKQKAFLVFCFCEANITD